MRLIIIALVLLFVALQYEFWFAKGGVITAWKLRDHVSVQQEKNQVLKQRNEAIRADITDLKSGDQSIEERARSGLGMVKKGETFYQVVKQNDAKTP